MEYKETSKELAEESDSNDELPLDLVFQQDSDFDEESSLNESEIEQLAKFEHLNKKTKTQTNTRFSLKARRAIEDHLERRRLRKELDYLFDDNFPQDRNENNA